MGCTVIAPVGSEMESIYQVINEFSVERLILLSSKDKISKAEDTKEDLEKFNFPVDIEKIEGNVWEGMFKEVGKAVRKFEDSKILVHTSTGSRGNMCAATCAAFVNGVQATATGEDGSIMALPVLKFSYYNMITDKKMNIIKFLYESDCCSSLKELSERTDMSLPLVSYHVNGNLKSEGLDDLGLVETRTDNGETNVELTVLGRMLVEGYIDQDEG